MITGELPKPEGVSEGMAVFLKDIPRIEIVNYQSPISLVALSKENHFFNAALLFAAGQLEYDPVLEFALLHGGAATVSGFRLAMPILSGLPLDLGRILYMVPRHEWFALRHHLIQLSVRDLAKGVFYQVAAQTLDVVDPVFAANASVIPTTGVPRIRITAFGLDANFGQLGYLPDPNPFVPPRVCKWPARPKIVALAAAVTAHDANPFQHTEELQ